MNTTCRSFFFAFVLALSLTSTASADVVFDNLSQTALGSTPLTALPGASFTTLSGTGYLTVTLGLTGSGAVTARLYNDAGNKPGTTLYSTMVTSVTSPTFSFPSYSVSPLTRYWIMLTGAGVRWVNSPSSSNGTGVKNEFVYLYGHSYANTVSGPDKMLVNITSVTPEPSTYLLLCISLGAVGIVRRKMDN